MSEAIASDAAGTSRAEDAATGPDWNRLQQALGVEAERGFGDIQGRQYRFSEFLCLSFGKVPPGLAADDRRRWRETSEKFAAYGDLTESGRKRLVAQTRQFLFKARRHLEERTAIAPAESNSPRAQENGAPRTGTRKIKPTNTADISGQVAQN